MPPSNATTIKKSFNTNTFSSILQSFKLNTPAATKKHKSSLLFNGGVSTREVMVFTRQLSATLKAGLLLTEAMDTIVEDLENPRFADVITTVLRDIRSGSSLSQALGRHTKVFPASYIAIVKSGEASGRMDKTMENLAKYLEASERLREKVKSALTYPSFVVGFAIMVVMIIVFFLIPKFKETFDSFHAKLPMITLIVIGTSEFAVKYAWVFLLGLMASVVAYFYFRQFPKFKYWVDVLKLKIPFLGRHVIQKSMVARFCRTLGFLLSSGVGLSPALEIASQVLNHNIFGQAIFEVHQRVLGGAHLAQEIRKQNIFPKLVSKMTAVGEKSGQMPQMLLQTADYYEDELENTLHKLTSLLEPILIVFIGGVVLVVVLALYLPIFKMATVIK